MTLNNSLNPNKMSLAFFWLFLCALFLFTEEGSTIPEDNADDSVLNWEGRSFDALVFGSSSVSNSSGTNYSDQANGKGIRGLFSVRWTYVEGPLVVCVFLLLASLAKIGFYHADFLSSFIPESCLLISLGVAVGGVIRILDVFHLTLPVSYFEFSARTFFLFLLPPVMLENAYSLHDRGFGDNIGTILLYAVFGAAFNVFTIGPTLWVLSRIGAMGTLSIRLIECLAFSSLISAVEPEAVLDIFKEIGANSVVYFLLFGESALSDMVTVLYSMMVTLAGQPVVGVAEMGLALVSSAMVTMGGIFIGTTYGVLTALITKYTDHVRVVEPLAVFLMAYVSYLTAELLRFSGVISIIMCGLVQWQYAVHNVSFKSRTTVKYFSKMASSVCDAVIFLVLGLVIVNESHVWHTGFVMWTLLTCILYRFVMVFGITWLSNKLGRMQEINSHEQFIMAYGGLRGAISFSLANLLAQENFEHRNMLVTTTVVVILFTVFLQGTTSKPLVKLLGIRQTEVKKPSIFEATNLCMFDHVLSGAEEISGCRGQNYWRELFDYYDEKYLQRWLQRKPVIRGKLIVDVFIKQCLKEHFAHLFGAPQANNFLNKQLRRQESDVSITSILPTAATTFNQLNIVDGRLAPPTLAVGKRSPITTSQSDQISEKKLPALSPASSIVITEASDVYTGQPEKVAVVKHAPIVSMKDILGADLYKTDKKRLTGFRKHAKSFGHDVREALDNAVKNAPYVQIRRRYNPNLINDDETELTYQLRQRTLRARRMSNSVQRRRGRRGDGLAVRSFFSGLGNSMSSLVNLSRSQPASPSLPENKASPAYPGVDNQDSHIPTRRQPISYLQSTSTASSVKFSIGELV